MKSIGKRDFALVVKATHKSLNQSAFTSAIWTDDADKIIFVDVEIDIAECLDIVVRHTQVTDRNYNIMTHRLLV